MRTFDDLFGNTSPAERDALAWHLATLRAKRTYEALRHSSKKSLSSGDRR